MPDKLKKIKECLCGCLSKNKTKKSQAKYVEKEEQHLELRSVKKAWTAPSKKNINVPHEQKIVALSDFELIKVLGKGSFGKVLLVEFKDSVAQYFGENYYAMKLINKSSFHNRNQAKNDEHKFFALLEKDILLKSKHPFINQLKWSFQTQDKLFYVMELCKGGSLRTIAKRKQMDNRCAKFCLQQLVLALEYLHKERKITHRDIKNDNVLVHEDGYIQLADFGISTNINQNKIKTYAGTINFMAPEVIAKRWQNNQDYPGYTESVDLWSLGMIFVEYLLGYNPIWKRISASVQNMHQNTVQQRCKMYESFLDIEISKAMLPKIEYEFLILSHDYSMLKEELQEKEISPQAQNLIYQFFNVKQENQKKENDNFYSFVQNQILKQNPKERLSDFNEIKNHPYFTEEQPIYDWDQLLDKQYQSPIKQFVRINRESYHLKTDINLDDDKDREYSDLEDFDMQIQYQIKKDGKILNLDQNIDEEEDNDMVRLPRKSKTSFR